MLEIKTFHPKIDRKIIRIPYVTFILNERNTKVVLEFDNGG